MMRLLFENLAEKHFSSARVEKFKGWIQAANKATEKLDRKVNQYYKAEELITFYALAPLVLESDKEGVVKEILRLAGVKVNVEKVDRMSFEELVQPPTAYLSWIENEVKNHPIKYVREQAKDHKKRRKPLETATHVDAVIETDNLTIFFEMKFTSDISVQTTFNPCRNQLARLVDVGISKAIQERKKLVLLLCTPALFFVNKSRFYSHKIIEYSDYEEIERDIGWREKDDIEKCVSAVAWVSLESLVKATYKDFIHPDAEEALLFFRERNLA